MGIEVVKVKVFRQVNFYSCHAIGLIIKLGKQAVITAQYSSCNELTSPSISKKLAGEGASDEVAIFCCHFFN